jgi:hypothetical protein
MIINCWYVTIVDYLSKMGARFYYYDEFDCVHEQLSTSVRNNSWGIHIIYRVRDIPVTDMDSYDIVN